MSDDSEPDAKILFRVPYDDDSDDAEIETLWAFHLGNDLYRLDNLPYFAYSVSWNDIVFAPLDVDEGFPTYRHVAEKSGNRTIRIIADPAHEPGNKTDQILEKILRLGCEYEGANSKFFAINIPPAVDFDSLVQLLIDNSVEFEYADPSYDELYPDED